MPKKIYVKLNDLPKNDGEIILKALDILNNYMGVKGVDDAVLLFLLISVLQKERKQIPFLGELRNATGWGFYRLKKAVEKLKNKNIVNLLEGVNCLEGAGQFR